MNPLEKLQFQEAMNQLKEDSRYMIEMFAMQAKMFKAYFDSMKAEGFTDRQALAMTVEYSKIILSGN